MQSTRWFAFSRAEMRTRSGCRRMTMRCSGEKWGFSPNGSAAAISDSNSTDDDAAALAGVFDVLSAEALRQPRVFVHRDYHSRNLMVTDAARHGANPGILDFQDAVYGPVTYDLVSLLRDCYVAWPP